MALIFYFCLQFKVQRKHAGSNPEVCAKLTLMNKSAKDNKIARAPFADASIILVSLFGHDSRAESERLTLISRLICFIRS